MEGRVTHHTLWRVVSHHTHNDRASHTHTHKQTPYTLWRVVSHTTHIMTGLVIHTHMHA